MTQAPRDLRLLSGAVLLSAAGDMLLVVVLALRVHDLTGSGFAVAALFAALMAPMVVLAPLAGRLVDGVETRRLLLLVSLAQAAVAGALVFADGLAPILVLTALLGAGAAVAGPAEAALVPPRSRDGPRAGQRLGRDRALLGLHRRPAAGRRTDGGRRHRLGLAANAASFGAVALAAALMRVRRVPRGPRGVARSTAVFAAAVRRPDAAVAIGAAVAALVFISASITVEVFYVATSSAPGPSGYSLVFAGWMARHGDRRDRCGVADQGAARRRRAGRARRAGRRHGRRRVVAVLAWVIAGFFVGGIGHGVKNVLLRTLIQQRVPAEAHGRAFAAYNAARNTAELGALAAGGVIVGVLGAQPALFIAGPRTGARGG